MINTNQALRSFAVAANNLEDAIELDVDAIRKVSLRRKREFVENFPFDDALARIDEFIAVISNVRAQVNGDLVEATFKLAQARETLNTAKESVSGNEVSDLQILAQAFRHWETIQRETKR